MDHKVVDDHRLAASERAAERQVLDRVQTPEPIEDSIGRWRRPDVGTADCSHPHYRPKGLVRIENLTRRCLRHPYAEGKLVENTLTCLPTVFIHHESRPSKAYRIDDRIRPFLCRANSNFLTGRPSVPLRDSNFLTDRPSRHDEAATFEGLNRLRGVLPFRRVRTAAPL
jgi:hypothetical protein